MMRMNIQRLGAGLAALAVLSGLLTSCSAGAAPSEKPGPEAAQSGQASSWGSAAESGEPPLSSADLDLAVPDFLTQEQQTLYRRAHSFYEHLQGDAVEYWETFKLEQIPPEPYETVAMDDVTYLIAQGRYADWDLFNAVGRSIFTEAYWVGLNTSEAGPDPRIGYEGKLCFLDTSMGGGYYYCDDVPDTFRLEERTEDTIRFTLTGHYRYFGNEPEDETEEQRRARLDRGWDYTLEFPIELVQTEEGWRFSEFHSALLEEDEPPLTQDSSGGITDLAEGDYEYAVQEDGTVKILRYRGTGGDVVIPSQLGGRPVTAIGYSDDGFVTGAFAECETLTSVVIPEGVREIQDNAFQSCHNLKMVTIPATVTILWNCAFDDCTALQSVYFQGDAPETANYVFSGETPTTVYYHEGTAGWTDPWYGLKTEPY